MPKYVVYIPVTAVVAVEIKADNETEAKQEALKVDLNMSVKGTRASRKHKPELCEWELHEYISKGNVFYGVQNEIEVEQYE